MAVLSRHIGDVGGRDRAIFHFIGRTFMQLFVIIITGKLMNEPVVFVHLMRKC